MLPGKVSKVEEYVFPTLETAAWGQKICSPAADDLFRVSPIKNVNKPAVAHAIASLIRPISFFL